MYICVELSFRDLNPDPYLLHPTSIYTYGVTTVVRMHGNEKSDIYGLFRIHLFC